MRLRRPIIASVSIKAAVSAAVFLLLQDRCLRAGSETASYPKTVIDFGADPTGHKDSADAFNRAALAGNSNVVVPPGIFKLSKPLSLRSTASGGQCLIGQGWNSVIKVSPDFDPSVPGVILIPAKGEPDTQFCVTNLRISFEQPRDLEANASEGAKPGTKHLHLNAVDEVKVGDILYNLNHPASLDKNFPGGRESAVKVVAVRGNIVSISSEVRSPGVSAGDVISVARPRRAFTKLQDGCSSSPGASGCMYPWAIYNPGADNFMLEHVLVDGAWNGIFQRGGTYHFDNVYVGAMNIALNQDECHNFPQISHFEAWNFGFSDPHHLAFVQNYYDGNTICATFGANDGLSASSIQCWTGKMVLSSSFTWGHFVNTMLDGTHSGLLVNLSRGWVYFDNIYFTGGVSSLDETALHVRGGYVHMTGLELVEGAGLPAILVDGGALFISGSVIHAGDTDGAFATLVRGNGTLDIENSLFTASPDCRVDGMAMQEGAGVLRLHQVRFLGRCSNTNTAVVFTKDHPDNRAEGMSLGGWVVDGPYERLPHGPVGKYDGTQLRMVGGLQDKERVTDGEIVWDSDVEGTRQQSIFGCGVNNRGQVLTILLRRTDLVGHPIAVVPQGGTVDGVSRFFVRPGSNPAQFMCDGSSNWVVLRGH